MDQQEKRVEAVRQLLISLNENPRREGLLDTPKRVAKMYDEIFGGYNIDPKELILSATFRDEEHRELVLVKDIPFYSHCEHHMVPFFGTAHVAYIPNGTVVGLSKIARLVDAYARRLQIQERLTTQIADTLMNTLNPMAVGVIITAEHLCMAMRGVRKPGAQTTTSAMRGIFLHSDNAARLEFLSLIK